MKALIFSYLSLFMYFSNYAQDPQLFENTWYLQNVIINGYNNYPPSNDEVEFVSVTFAEPDNLNTYVCNTFDSELLFSNPNEFFIISYSISLIFCNLQVNTDFEGIYFDIFFNEKTQDPYTEPFIYDIVINGPQKTLTIINVNGDSAIYSNELLSIQELDNLSFEIYPNPVTNKLFISSIFDLTDIKIWVMTT